MGKVRCSGWSWASTVRENSLPRRSRRTWFRSSRSPGWPLFEAARAFTLNSARGRAQRARSCVPCSTHPPESTAHVSGRRRFLLVHGRRRLWRCGRFLRGWWGRLLGGWLLRVGARSERGKGQGERRYRDFLVHVHLLSGRTATRAPDSARSVRGTRVRTVGHVSVRDRASACWKRRRVSSMSHGRSARVSGSHSLRGRGGAKKSPP